MRKNRAILYLLYGRSAKKKQPSKKSNLITFSIAGRTEQGNRNFHFSMLQRIESAIHLLDRTVPRFFLSPPATSPPPDHFGKRKMLRPPEPVIDSKPNFTYFAVFLYGEPAGMQLRVSRVILVQQHVQSAALPRQEHNMTSLAFFTESPAGRRFPAVGKHIRSRFPILGFFLLTIAMAHPASATTEAFSPAEPVYSAAAAVFSPAELAHPAATATPSPADLADPFIGSGGIGYEMGNIQPGAQAPFGMVRLGPDTSMLGGAPFYARPGGYYYLDLFIRGFSHTHLTGTGAEDYGNIRFTPVTKLDEATITDAGRSSRFLHATEEATPGYYAVTLDDPGVRAELTALPRSGYHRYTFEPDGGGFLLLDVSASLTADGCAGSGVAIDPDSLTVSGWIHNKGSLSGRFGGYTLYFHGLLDTPVNSFGTWKNGVISEGSYEEEGDDIGAWIGFDTPPDHTVFAAVGISYISIDQAARNLAAEMPGCDFDACRAEAAALWDAELEQITVTGGSEADREIFYSSLYRLKLMPTNFTEEGDLYAGFDGAAHQADGFSYYTDMSLWDTFRTFHPLMALIDPERANDMATSLVKMYEQGGDIPRWPLATGYTGCMIGTSADIVFADALAKGIDGFDVETAYEGCRLHATEPRPHAGRDGIGYYIEKGYCPVDLVSQGPSKTLEYAYADRALANFAKTLGYDDDYEMFLARSYNYRNTWFGPRNFFRGRNDNGTWHFPFLPTWVFDEEFIEGDAWHWLWSVPHDVPGLIDLFGSEAAFLRKLGNFFHLASISPDTPLPDQYYWHGNEPDIHAAYMFNYTERPDLTQKWVHWIMDTKYGTGPDGLDGNDDGGTLSAWYIFSALGFYPIAGSDWYLTGSPRFEEARVLLPGGELIVSTRNFAPGNIYVRSVRLNGELLSRPFFRHAEIASGGSLEFEMESP